MRARRVWARLLPVRARALRLEACDTWDGRRGGQHASRPVAWRQRQQIRKCRGPYRLPLRLGISVPHSVAVALWGARWTVSLAPALHARRPVRCRCPDAASNADSHGADPAAATQLLPLHATCHRMPHTHDNRPSHTQPHHSLLFGGSAPYPHVRPHPPEARVGRHTCALGQSRQQRHAPVKRARLQGAAAVATAQRQRGEMD